MWLGLRRNLAQFCLIPACDLRTRPGRLQSRGASRTISCASKLCLSRIILWIIRLYYIYNIICTKSQSTQQYKEQRLDYFTNNRIGLS
jgi:hypothetical protein